MAKIFLQVTLIYSLSLLCVDTYKILGLFPHHGKSHFDMFEVVLKSLAEKGHEVTVISYYPQVKPIPRYKDISLKGSAKLRVGVSPVNSDQLLSRIAGWFEPFELLRLANESCESGLQMKGVQELISSDEKFDLILTEAFNTDCFLGFAHKYKVPVIALSSCALMPWSSNRFGEPNNPAYIPDNLLQFSDRMSFLQRVENTVMLLFHNTVFKYFCEPNDQRIARKYFGDDIPPLKRIAYNTSILLVNTHYTLNLPRPNVPGVIEIGGVHITKTANLNKVRFSILDLLSKDDHISKVNKIIQNFSSKKSNTMRR